LVYNLIRSVMAQAVSGSGLKPWEISFTGALQTLGQFAPVLQHCAAAEVTRLCGDLLRALRQHRVGQRPNRVEPRARKRRPKCSKFLNEPRNVARTRLLKKRCA
jgi:hypothetical protein